jgi:lambda family phage portal protein
MGLIQKIKEIWHTGSAPPQPMQMGAYYGVGGGLGSYGSSFRGEKWPGGLSSSGSGIVLDHKILRQNARTTIHRTPQAKAVSTRFVDTVIDTGLILDCQPMADVLGLDPEEARAWGEDTSRRFHLWATSKKSSIDEVDNFYQLQRLAGLSQIRDGEFFIRLHYTNRRDLSNPLQLQFIDPDQIDGCGFTSTFGIQYRDDGISRDKNGKETGYLVSFQQKDGTYKQVEVPAFGSKSGRRFMIHSFSREYAGQGRGFTKYAHMIQEFENITDFSSAQIKKAINQSQFTMFVEPSENADASNPLENQVTEWAGVASAAYGATPAGSTSETPVPFDDLLEYVPLPEATDRVPGSVGLFNLHAGETVKPFESTAPSQQFNQFVDSFTSHLAASVSMPIEVLLMKFGTSYSASRAALVLFWRVAQIQQMELAADFLNVIFESWLSEEIARGQVSAPGWTDPMTRQAWLNNTWIGAPMPTIDPSRAAKAEQIYAELGAKDLDTIARETNGSDGRANRTKLTRQYDELPAAPWNQKSEPANGGGDDNGQSDDD